MPHRPLSTPGAQSTVNFSRGPLENSPIEGRSLAAAVEEPAAQSSYGDESATDTPATETLRSAHPVSQEVVDPPGEMLHQQAPGHLEAPGKEPEHPTFVPPRWEPLAEESPPDLVEDLHHPPLNEPGVKAAAVETPAPPPDVSDFMDGLATSLAEPSKPVEAEHFPWMDGVMEQIELEAAKSEAAKHSEEGDERPRFLDVLGDLSLPAVAPDAPASTAVTPTPAEQSQPPQPIARPAAQYGVERPSGRPWWTWLATAAVLVFAFLGAMEWLSRRNDAIMGPLEFVKTQARKWEPSDPAVAKNDESGPSADSAQPNTSSQATQTAEPPAPQAQKPATDANTPAAAPSQNPELAKTTVPASAAPQVQSPPPAQDHQSTSVKNIVPGERETNRAEHTRNAVDKSVWLWRATAKGNPEAPVQLAEMYIKGDGVPRSCEQAVVLLKTAAINNNARACNRLAAMYTIGTCVTRNHVKAYRWLSAAVAADPTSESAQQNRDLIWNQMTPEERTLAEKYR